MAITYLSGQRIQGSSTGTSSTPTKSKAQFASGTWTSQGTAGILSESSGVISFDIDSDDDSADSGFTLDLGSGNEVSDAKWILRTKFVYSTNTISSPANACTLAFGIADTTTISGEAEGNGNDIINPTIHLQDNSNNIYMVIDSTKTAGNNRTTRMSIGTTYYLQVQRVSATSAEFKVFSDSTYETQVGTTSSVSPTTSLTGGRYVFVHFFAQTLASGSATGSFTDWELWNNASIVDDQPLISDIDDKETLVTATEVVADQDDGWVHIDQSPNQEYLYDSGGGGTGTNPLNTWNFLHDGSTYSVSLWVYRDGAQGANEPCYLSTCGVSASYIGADLWSDNTSDGEAYWFISDGTGSDSKSVTVGNIPNTTWANIIITNDGTDLKAYLNGTLSNTTSLSGFTPSTSNSNYKLYVGRNNRGGTDMANVKMSMAGFWEDHVLSAGDIEKLKDGRRPRADGVGFDYSSSDIVHLYPLNNAGDLCSVPVGGGGVDGHRDLSNHYGRATYSTNQASAPTSSGAGYDYSSNLQIGTQFEETDTRKFFQISESNGWVQRGTAI